MNKFALTFAVLALVNNVTAIKINDDDDLFTDNASEQETLQSIAQAEKAQGKTFNGISADDQKELIGERSKLTFEGDSFVKNDKRTFGDAKLIQLNEPEFNGQSIGSFASVLSGTQLNDEDDARTTLESLKSSETIKNAKMATPETKEILFQTTGSQYYNVLAENKRISTKDLDDAMLDHDEEALVQ